MDLKHLEDFISLCETRSFSRSAEIRNVTQSAFSRRIQALELWLGTTLVDRSSYPLSLTATGRQFRETADETLSMLSEARAEIQVRERRSRKTISFAALHTLAISVFPRWLREIEHVAGPLKTEMLADNAYNCFQALVDGKSDFLLTFHHEAVPLSLDPELFPHILLGTDRLLSVSCVKHGKSVFKLDNTAPLLAYGRESFLGKLSFYAARAAGIDQSPSHVNDNAIAEILKAMVLAGHGIAWLPESLIKRELESKQLEDLGASLSMDIRMYRSIERTRQSVIDLWDAANSLIDRRRF